MTQAPGSRRAARAATSGWLRLTLACAALAPSVSLAEARTYRIEPEATELVAITQPAGLLASFSQPHLLVARAIDGTVVHDAAEAGRCRIEVRAPSEALEVDDPVRRRRHGLTQSMSQEVRREVLAAVRSPAQLDVAAFPELSFVSLSVSGPDAEHLTVKGVLSLHGVSAEVEVPVAVAAQDGLLRASGSLRITHAQFGMKPFSFGFGTVRNAEAIELRLVLVAREEREATTTRLAERGP
jgi:polyisoprenoid-binding protein YceI